MMCFVSCLLFVACRHVSVVDVDATVGGALFSVVLKSPPPISPSPPFPRGLIAAINQAEGEKRPPAGHRVFLDLGL